MNDTLTITMLAGGAAGLLVLAAALLLSWEASQRDLARHVRQVVSGGLSPRLGSERSAGGVLVGPIRRLGELLQASALFSPANIAQLNQAAVAAGLNPQRVVPLVIAGKTILFLGCPALAYIGASFAGINPTTRLVASAVGVAVGMLGPNWALAYARRLHVAALRRGLPDALDLLVVCAEAGLGLESAVERVALEMRPSNRPVAMEFTALGQDLRLSSDRQAAFTRMGERTGLADFQRVGSTLSQTMHYGTPLGHALRVLASEMRNERMIRLEERAARLPALLTLPMILFILPCLFIVLAGPAAIRILNAFSH